MAKHNVLIQSKSARLMLKAECRSVKSRLGQEASLVVPRKNHQGTTASD